MLWFTGLSGGGKSTIAGALETRLANAGFHTYLLDGDNVRHGLCGDLGSFTQDRRENIRRIGELAPMADAGLLCCLLLSRRTKQRENFVKDLLEEGEFIEIYVNTRLEVCEQRDPKGLYKKARAGEIQHLTGIDSEYQPPLNPDLELLAGESSPSDLAESTRIALLKERDHRLKKRFQLEAFLMKWVGIITRNRFR